MGEELEPGDQLWIGPVGPIQIWDETDPEFIAERAAWHEPRARAQAMVTVEEHLAGLADPDWRCRHEVSIASSPGVRMTPGPCPRF